jgi:hypothetical protein
MVQLLTVRRRTHPARVSKPDVLFLLLLLLVGKPASCAAFCAACGAAADICHLFVTGNACHPHLSAAWTEAG